MVAGRALIDPGDGAAPVDHGEAFFQRAVLPVRSALANALARSLAFASSAVTYTRIEAAILDFLPPARRRRGPG